jgi:hypothetical protein
MDNKRKIRILETIHYKTMRNEEISINLIRGLEKIIKDLGGNLYSTNYLYKKVKEEKKENKILFSYNVAMEKADEFPDWFKENYSDYDYFKEQVLSDVENGYNSFNYSKEIFAKKVIKEIKEGIAGMYLIENQF